MIPDFGPGGGGHMTIFRMVKHLERKGHRITFGCWIQIAAAMPPICATTCSSITSLSSQGLPLDASFFFSSGDAVIATSWQTVDAVTQAQGFKERFYFIQDYEPFFYARGSEAVQAEATYSRGLACICASPWLDQIMRERFGAWSRTFWLAFDHRTYHCTSEQLQRRCQHQQGDEHEFHLAVYARRFTERRCVELAFAALEQLCRTNGSVVVHLFGDPRPLKAGISSHPSRRDRCRATGQALSLLRPGHLALRHELFADPPGNDGQWAAGGGSGGGKHRSDLPGGGDCPGPPSAEGLARPSSCWILLSPCSNKPRLPWRGSANSAGTKLALQLKGSDRAHRDVDGACTREGIAFQQPLTVQPKQPKYKASVVIPTHNAGTILAPVLSALQINKRPGSFSVLIDSASSDGTLEQLHAFSERQPNVTIQQIAKQDFSTATPATAVWPGVTRVRGVSHPGCDPGR